MSKVRSVHQRAIEASPAAVGSLLDQLAGDPDPLWPAPRWPPIRFDRPLSVGADGGHGPIPYTVAAYEPGRRIRFRFDPALGIDGHHELVVEPVATDRCVLRHELEGEAHGAVFLRWMCVLRWLHDALIEDLFDNAQQAITGKVVRPARWSPWVRLLRRTAARRRGRQQHHTRNESSTMPSRQRDSDARHCFSTAG